MNPDGGHYMTGLVRAVLCVLCAFVANPVSAQATFPMVTHCTPVAVRRGTTAEVIVEGQQNLAGMVGWLCDAPGLTGNLILPPQKAGIQFPVKANDCRINVTVAKDVPLGPHEFRIVTKAGGPSTVGQLLVVDDPVVDEKGDNNTIAGANPLPVPGVACGRIEAAEDVDAYRFRAEAGKTYTFEVWGARLQDKIHDLQKHLDPILTVLDAAGREVAANDDYFFADPYLAWTAPAAGDYFVQIRDAKYDGDARWVYALCVTDRPYAAHVFPFAGNPGQTITVEPVGSAAKVAPTIRLQLPTTPGLHRVPLLAAAGPTNPVAVFVSSLPQLVARRDAGASSLSPGHPLMLPIPCGVSGRLEQPRDIDYFRFKGTKGKPIRFEVRARRFGTPLCSRLDSLLEVLSPKGQVLAANDDDPTTGKDSLLTFAPPADGEYTLRLRDLNSKGGPGYVYYLEADYARPDFTIRCDPDRAAIAAGCRTAWFVHVARANGFADPVNVEVHDLPPGVTASLLTIPPTMTQGTVVLAADKDAKVGAAANVRVVGAAGSLVHEATANEEIYLPGGGRGRFDVALQSVAVSEPGDILNVNVTPSVLTLKPGGEVTLEVTIERAEGFTKDVTLDVPLRHLNTTYGNPLPPGVSVVDEKSKTRLAAGESKGKIVLRVAPGAAPIENVPIAVTAYVSVNFVVKVGYSSPVIPLTISR
jgi:hypothetical protein